MGYPNIADIIAVHIDLFYVDEGKITEKEVIYLADKLTQGERILELDKRLESKLKQLTGNPMGKIAAEKRIRTAMQIQYAIEKIIGENINDLIYESVALLKSNDVLLIAGSGEISGLAKRMVNRLNEGVSEYTHCLRYLEPDDYDIAENPYQQ